MGRHLAVWNWTVLLAAAVAVGEDRVTYSAGADGRSRAIATGTIEDYTGLQLLLRTSAGSQQSIPTARIVAVESAWLPQQVIGRQRLDEGKHAEALEALSTALREEPRVWVQRQILADCVRCLSALGRREQAGEAFLRLVRSDPATQYFARIPLSWQAHQPSLGLEQKSLAWMKDASEVARLIGASWLLSSRHRQQAVQTLGGLAARSEPRVAALAAAQLWRTRVGAAEDAELERWQALIEKMPVELRGGPYFTAGQGLAARGHSQRAALLLMRLPILYSDDRDLAAAALLSAGAELEKIGRPAQAVGLYREILQDSADTAAAAQAAARLERLAHGEDQ